MQYTRVDLRMSRNEGIKLVICGVGGQGIMLISRAIMGAALMAGFKISGSEIHGHAVRGGSAHAIVTYGKNAGSPLIRTGDADVLIGMEMLEAARMIRYLKRGGVALVSKLKVVPINSMLRNDRYPSEDEVAQIFSRRTDKFFLLDVEKAAERFGGKRLSNSVLYGAFSVAIDNGIDMKSFEMALLENVPKGTEEANLAAFREGRRLIMSYDV